LEFGVCGIWNIFCDLFWSFSRCPVTTFHKLWPLKRKKSYVFSNLLTIFYSSLWFMGLITPFLTRDTPRYTGANFTNTQNCYTKQRSQEYARVTFKKKRICTS
jgi:hypothetical protein